MEIDITHLVDTDFDAALRSGSIAELGDNAGRITWDNSKRESAARPLLVGDDAIKEGRDYLRSTGGWTEKELDSYPDADIQAMILQFVAGDIRELEDCDGYDDYIRQADAGRVSGSISRGPGDKWYSYLGW